MSRPILFCTFLAFTACLAQASIIIPTPPPLPVGWELTRIDGFTPCVELTLEARTTISTWDIAPTRCERICGVGDRRSCRI